MGLLILLDNMLNDINFGGIEINKIFYPLKGDKKIFFINTPSF